MNIPKTQMDAEVTTWDNILATNQEMEDLTGCDCVVGIDYSKVSDMVGVCLLFRKTTNIMQYVMDGFANIVVIKIELKLLWKHGSNKDY